MTNSTPWRTHGWSWTTIWLACSFVHISEPVWSQPPPLRPGQDPRLEATDDPGDLADRPPNNDRINPAYVSRETARVESQRPSIVTQVPDSETTQVETIRPIDLPSAEEFRSSLVEGRAFLPMPPPRESTADPLLIEQVYASVDQRFPAILAARLEPEVAQGQFLSSLGNFDLVFSGKSTNYSGGYYRRFYQNFALDQPIPYGGIRLFAGYRHGVGQYPIYYWAERTRPGGEVLTGIDIPLFRNRTIDLRRATVFQADIARLRAATVPPLERIRAFRLAARAYWSWVAAAQRYLVTDDLLRNAEDRDFAFAESVKVGRLAPYERVQNQVFVNARRNDLIDELQQYRQAAFELALFRLDESGEPTLPANGSNPEEFPEPVRLPDARVRQDVQTAFRLRPELRQLALDLRSIGINRDLATNDLLWKINVELVLSQDIGPPTVLDNLVPIEFQTNVIVAVPFQRRDARGRIFTADAQLAQVAQRTRLISNQILNEIATAYAAIDRAVTRVASTRLAVETAATAERGAVEEFRAGRITFFQVNLFELQTFQNRLELITALADYHLAIADYRAAVGFDALSKLLREPRLEEPDNPDSPDVPDVWSVDPIDVEVIRVPPAARALEPPGT